MNICWCILGGPLFAETDVNSPNRACDEGVLTVLVRGPWIPTQIRHQIGKQLLCTGCGLGHCHCALVHAKRSVSPLLLKKHDSFGTFRLQDAPWDQMPPDVPDAPQMSPRCPQMSPRCLPEVSQMPPRCLPDASQQMPLRCLPPRCFKKTLFGGSRRCHEFLFVYKTHECQRTGPRGSPWAHT